MYLAEIIDFKARARILIDFSSKDKDFNPHKQFHPLLDSILKATEAPHSYGTLTSDSKKYGPVLIDFLIGENGEEYELEYPPEYTDICEEKERARNFEEAIDRIKILCSVFDVAILENVEVDCQEMYDNPEWYK